MSNWQSVLDLKDVWEDGVPSVIAEAIHTRLQELKFKMELPDWVEEERLRLIDEFEMLKSDPDLEADEFDDLFSELYDWADIALDDDWPSKKVCWVKTNF